MPDPILDQAALENLLHTIGGDKNFLAEMIETFFVDSQEQIALMQDAAVNQHPEVLRRAGHSLKSNAANFGAMDLAKLSKQVEELGKQNTSVGAADLIVQIKLEYARAAGALQVVLKS